MASTLVIAFLIAMPALGAIIGWLGILLPYRSFKSQSQSSQASPVLRTRVVALLMLPSELLVFSLALSIFYLSPKADQLPRAAQEYGAMAYGVPALITGIGHCILFSKGMKWFLRNGALFPRLLSLETSVGIGALLGLCISYLLVRSPFDALVDAQAFTDSSLRASLLVSLGGLGSIISGSLAAAVGDFGPTARFKKVLIRSISGSLYSLALFIPAFLFLP